MFFKKAKKKKKIQIACLTHATKLGMKEEFLEAYNFYGDCISALEEWDLLDDTILEQIKKIEQS